MDAIKFSGELIEKSATGRIAVAIVYQPGIRDAQGEIVVDPRELEAACHGFLEEGEVWLEHKHPLTKDQARVVESWIAPSELTLGSLPVRKGSWVVSLAFGESLWPAVVAKKYVGVSMGGSGIREPGGVLRSLRIRELSITAVPATQTPFAVLKAGELSDDELRARIADFCRRFDEFVNSQVVTSPGPKPVLQHDHDPAAFAEQEAGREYAAREREKASWAEHAENARQNAEVYRKLYGGR